MTRSPQVYHVDDLLYGRQHFLTNLACIGENGPWVPARPVGNPRTMFSRRSRLALAWMVFTGKADVLIWEGQ